jgi:hypothetical protein
MNDKFEECKTKMAVFWVVALCSPVYQIMEAASSSETSVNVCQTTRRHGAEDCHLVNLNSRSEHCLKVVGDGIFLMPANSSITIIVSFYSDST